MLNLALQRFVQDTYGVELWRGVVEEIDLGFEEFEAMLIYEDQDTYDIITAVCTRLDKDSAALLEDIGTYLVSHPGVDRLRRLLRFGGLNFTEFLHSLYELPDRVRMAVSDLELPPMEPREFSSDFFVLKVERQAELFGPVLMGVLRAMADDYGVLAFMELKEIGGGRANIEIRVAEIAYSEGRSFELGVSNG